jgi:hypothetical protein
MSTLDTGGEVAFRKDVLSFASTKDGRYSPPEERNSLFSWHISPLFDFATSITLGVHRLLASHHKQDFSHVCTLLMHRKQAVSPQSDTGGKVRNGAHFGLENGGSQA